MRSATDKHQSTEILVHGEKYAALARSPSEDFFVTRIRRLYRSLNDVVAAIAQPFSDPFSRATVDEKSQVALTFTASSRSSAITAWA